MIIHIAARRVARLPIASALSSTFAWSRYKSPSPAAPEPAEGESTDKTPPNGTFHAKASNASPIARAASAQPSKTPASKSVKETSGAAAGSISTEPSSATPSASATGSTAAPSQASDVPSSSASIPPRPVAVKPIRKVRTDPEERDYHAAVVNGRGLLTPYQHPAPYGIPVASIHFRSHWPHLLLQNTHFAQHAAASLGIPVSGVAMLPTKRTLWTVLRGPFVHKKSQENFERRVHKRAIKAFDADPEVVDRWIKYLERHSMAGVGMRIVRWHRVPVGVGKQQLESVVGQMRLQLDDTTGKDKLKDLVSQIIAQETKAAQGDSQESKTVSSP